MSERTILKKLSQLIRRDISDIMTKENAKKVGKMLNTEVGELLLAQKVKNFTDQISKEPGNESLYTELAELYLTNGDKDKAVETYEELIDILIDKNQFGKAEYFVNQCIDINPARGILHLILSEILLRRGLKKEAIDRLHLAEMNFVKSNDRISAIDVLRRLSELEPDNINYSIRLGSLLVAEKIFKEAENLLFTVYSTLKFQEKEKSEEYKIVLHLLYNITKVNMSDSGELITRDMLNHHLRTEDYSKALLVIQQLLLYDPQSLDFLEQYAFILKKLGKREKIVPVCKKIASIYEKRGNMKERNKYYLKVLRLAPDDPEILVLLHKENELREYVQSRIDSAEAD